ncbi:MAG: TonB-dependent receptor plug domain-containing protein [Bacteroidales bacterium]|nr:TonB-dependent receptor plug domain-containing protein [Bacteroidales bacterium]
MRKIFTLIIFFSFISFGFSQQQTITGTITGGDSNETLPGVSILVKGTTTGAITDYEGKYSITVEKGDVLIVSFVGYLDKEVTIKDQAFINIILVPNIEDLEEVIVIGYGTQRKSDITGSVTSIRTDDFNPGPVVSIHNYLQNTAPGVVLLQSSSQPGGGFDIKVRGTSSLLGNNGPLYVVDGLPITSETTEPTSSSRYRSSPDKNPLNGINPDDIISIEVLKDASATAIYGARGANGVILIRTK